ncbi:amidophosphoribosyltransferase [candidate division KSB1 bacterium]
MCFSKSVKANCGVVGVYGHKDAAQLSYLCLYALQHRGQEAAGIVTTNGEEFNAHKSQGLVSEIFSDKSILNNLNGGMAIGHNRYSTTGGNTFINAQPLVLNLKNGPIAISHNGNLVNSYTIRQKLMEIGSIFQTTSDSEIIGHLIAKSRKTSFEDQVKDSVKQIDGAFSFILMTNDTLAAVRDPMGFRPLCIGKKDGAYIITSESCALDLIKAEYVRDVEPGELIIIDKEGFRSEIITRAKRKAYCIFEQIYFSRPDSKIFGEYVDKARRKFGKNLALESPADAEIVISVPDSSNTAALGYSHTSKIKYEIGLIRNHYIGRTFIHPIQSERDFSVRVKYNSVGGVLDGRKVIVIEDSIVRGTTLRTLVKMIRAAGAKEVHIRVSSPPIKYPCYYGMDFPTKEELIANNKTIDEIRDHMDVDSLEYFSLKGLLSSVENGETNFCNACFSGDYPTSVEEDFSKDQYEKSKKSC